jgi:chromosome segregation ATPase
MTTANVDLNGILQQVKGLESEKERLQKQLEEAVRRAEDALSREAEAQAKSEKLSESKRAEMQQALQGVIKTWLKDSVEDEKVRQEFEDGMQRLVKDTKEDSGVWKLVCCASQLHARRLEEVEQLRVECDSLRSKQQGTFHDDASRKRARDDPEKGATGNVWDDFESSLRAGVL